MEGCSRHRGHSAKALWQVGTFFAIWRNSNGTSVAWTEWARKGEKGKRIVTGQSHKALWAHIRVWSPGVCDQRSLRVTVLGIQVIEEAPVWLAFLKASFWCYGKDTAGATLEVGRKELGIPLFWKVLGNFGFRLDRSKQETGLVCFGGRGPMVRLSWAHKGKWWLPFLSQQLQASFPVFHLHIFPYPPPSPESCSIPPLTKSSKMSQVEFLPFSFLSQRLL